MSTFAYRSYNIVRSVPKFRIRGKLLTSLALAGSVTALAYTYSNNNNNNNNNNNSNGNNFINKALFGFGATSVATSNVREASSTTKDIKYYQSIYNEIAKKLIDEDDFDDGSYGPILVRLAWHNSGSYDQNDKTETKGGSYGGTFRFKTEQEDPANAGLVTGMKFLQSIKDKFPDLSYGDLFTLGGVVSIQEMQGPKIAWRPGRVDLPIDVSPPYGRLPDASQTKGNYLRSVFTDRLGFTDQELVVLIGVGHSIGRCHTTSSGYDGPWTFSPTVVSNEFFKLLLSEEWKFKNWNGPKQYEDEGSHSLMMLPADMILKTDGKFKEYVEIYAKDQDRCFNDFAVAFAKLLERGVKFDSKQMYFKTLDEQGL